MVRRIHSAGPNVRLELVAESGERLCAELTQERYRSLNISRRQHGLRHAPRHQGVCRQARVSE